MWKWECENPIAVIVMVHGASEHHGRYKWLVEMWRGEHINVINGDLPGQGTSTRKRGHINTFDEYIEEIQTWIDEAKKYNVPIFLFGHSMGGLAAIRTMQEKNPQVDGVILSSPCLGLVNPPSATLDLVSRALNYISPGTLFKSHLEPGIATRNKEVIELDENDTLYVRKISVRWYRELMKAIKLAHLNTNKFPDVPMLILQAGDDRIVDKQRVRKWFDAVSVNDKMFKEWEGLYHEVFNEPEREQVFSFTKDYVNMRINDKKIRRAKIEDSSEPTRFNEESL